MSSAGYLSGIISTLGVYTFTLEVTDSSRHKQTSAGTMTVIAANWSGFVGIGTFT